MELSDIFEAFRDGVMGGEQDPPNPYPQRRQRFWSSPRSTLPEMSITDMEGFLAEILGESESDQAETPFTPSFDMSQDSAWYWPNEIKDLIGGSWELENKVIGKQKPHVSGLW